MYPLIPYKHLVINTSLSRKDAAKLVLDNISPPRSLFQIQPSIPRKEFEGNVSRDGFTLNRIIHGRNSFLPIVNGKFTSGPKGTRFDLYLTLHPIVIALLLISSLPFFGMIITTIEDFILYGDFTISSLDQLGILIGIFYLIGIISFARETKKAEEFMKKILKSRKATN